jgi:MFS family permease
LGSFVSPLIAGYLVSVGANGTQDFSKVFIFFAIVSAIAAICAMILREKKTTPVSAKLDEKKAVS